jgi:hypothetical protein
MKESKYLEFWKAGYTGETDIYDVLSKSCDLPFTKHRSILGHIKWYGPWRQYCFWPSPQTIFNPACLQDIREFIGDLMAERKCVRGKR